MSKISMYVMAHKKFDAPQNEIYKPMQVGAALHDDLGYIRDDSGDNISTKNPNYSELTGMYWAWKNDHDSDIVGICHYRRFFADEDLKLLDRATIEACLDKADVVTTYAAQLKNDLYSDYCLTHNAEDMAETKKAIRKLYPDYLNTFDELMGGRKLFFANMMIARKNVFDAYCKWLFDILFEVEKNLDISAYNDYNKRVFGFISERLLGVWLQKNGLKVCGCRVIVSGDKVESTELVEWGVECINKGEYDKLISRFDERRIQYSDLFQEGSDAAGHLNFIYKLAGDALENNGRADVLKGAAEKYFARNYYLEYMRCMFDILRDLKSGSIILGGEHAVYGIDLAVLSDAVPLSMLTQDLYYDAGMLDKALALADPGQIRCCILIARDGILYEKTKDSPAGAGVSEIVFDVLFAESGEKSIQKPWEFVPDGLLNKEEKNAIENACRSISLKKGGFFNDTNPRGSNLSLRDPEGFDIQKKDPTTRQIYEENIKQLNDLAGKCSSENIRFIIVVPPFGKCEDDGKRKELRAELLDVLDELPYPVEYQDLNSEIWEGIFFEEDFYNDELLNRSGARKFSQILNELTSMDQV